MNRGAQHRRRLQRDERRTQEKKNVTDEFGQRCGKIVLSKILFQGPRWAFITLRQWCPNCPPTHSGISSPFPNIFQPLLRFIFRRYIKDHSMFGCISYHFFLLFLCWVIFSYAPAHTSTSSCPPLLFIVPVYQSVRVPTQPRGGA